VTTIVGSFEPSVKQISSAPSETASTDGYRVDVYAHYLRHDVEKHRPAPLTR
jgi:hypothetical protein